MSRTASGSKGYIPEEFVNHLHHLHFDWHFFHMSSQLKQNAYQLGSSPQVGVNAKILETNIWIMVTWNLPDGQKSECSGCIGDWQIPSSNTLDMIAQNRLGILDSRWIAGFLPSTVWDKHLPSRKVGGYFGISNILNPKMEVDGRWCSFSTWWFLGCLGGVSILQAKIEPLPRCSVRLRPGAGTGSTTKTGRKCRKERLINLL